MYLRRRFLIQKHQWFSLLFQKYLSDDCVFEEHIEENNYNTYSRVRGGKKTYLALNNQGKARRTQIPVTRQLGNLSWYALTLTKRWEGHGVKLTQCPTRRHHGKLKRPPKKHTPRVCMATVHRQNMRQKRKHKKANNPKKKRHPKARRRHGNGTTTTTEMNWDESTMSTMSTTTDVEFFRSATAQEAVGRAWAPWSQSGLPLRLHTSTVPHLRVWMNLSTIPDQTLCLQYL